VDPLFEPYFAGLAESRIRVPSCVACGRRQFPPRGVCPACQGLDFEWIDMPTSGTVYTFVTTYRAFHPWFAERVPYASVVADLGDGIRVMGACFDDAELVRCGAPVDAAFVPADGLTVLEWHLHEPWRVHEAEVR
jgi:uncharacterized OB-fold protein